MCVLQKIVMNLQNPKQENIDKMEWRCSSHRVNECKMLQMQRTFKKHDEDKKVCVCECKCKFVQNMEGNESLIYTPEKKRVFSTLGGGRFNIFHLKSLQPFKIQTETLAGRVTTNIIGSCYNQLSVQLESDTGKTNSIVVV